MATITDVKPCYAKAGDTITIIGTDFADTPSETKVYHRKHGATTWENVDPTRVTYVSATELQVSIDAGNTDGWDNGLCDVGVSDSGESTPDDWLAQAIFFYTVGAFSPDDVIKGAVEELYVDGVFMGHTHGSLDIEHSVETSDIEVDQSLLPVRTIKAGETFSLSVPLAEVTLEHIREVWGISANIEDLGSGRRRLTFGGDTAITEKPAMLVLPAGSGNKFALTFYRCAVLASGTLSWSKEEQVDLPIQLTVLADTSRPAGDQVGRWEEYAA
jgi:hypothetical protein